MVFNTDHIHIKTPDPDATVKWYVDNLDAGQWDVAERVDQHGAHEVHARPALTRGIAQDDELHVTPARRRSTVCCKAKRSA